MKLGISGRLTRAFIRSPLTPLFLLATLAAGLVAVLTIPRDEDPQIHVPMVDVMVQANGLKAADAAELVTKPLETILKAIPGVEHIYSETQDDQVMVTARFVVGTNEDAAVLRVNDKIRANMDRIPVGIPPPLIVGRGINDVAILALTLTPKPDAARHWNEGDLSQLATKLQDQLIKVPNVGLSYISGDDPMQIRVEPEPDKLLLYGVTLQQLASRVADANRSFVAGSVFDQGGLRGVAAGQTLFGVPDIGLLLLTTRDGRPVYVRDVAQVVVGPAPTQSQVFNIGRDAKGSWRTTPAVTVALAKRAGSNAVVVAADVLARVKTLEGSLIPPDVSVQVTRDYGRTADEKANELLFHLGAGDGLDRGADRACGGLAGGSGDPGGDPDHHPGHVVRLRADGLLDQPRLAVRADLRHRHPGRRRDRGGGEHRPALGDAPGALGRESRRRAAIEAVAEVGNPDRGRHPDGDHRPAADAVRFGTDGAVHGTDSGQCLGGDAVLLLRCHGGGALADVPAAPARRPSRARRRRWSSWNSRPRHSSTRRERAAAHPDRLGRIYRAVAAPLLATRRRALDVPDPGRPRHHRRLRAVLHRERHRQTVAVR